MLPPKTEKVWSFLSQQPALKGFVLIGGSALALRIQHRISEDLDLAFPAERLPCARLDALLRAAAIAGIQYRRANNEEAVHEFADGGLNLDDYQQDFVWNCSVKVSFFAPEPPMIKVLAGASEPRARVATLEELFKTKCLVSALRSKTRDWLDLFLLMRDHGFTIRDYADAFAQMSDATQRDIGLIRLCSGVPQKDDEGYAHLLPNAPSLEEMKAFFVAQRDKLEIELAKDAKRKSANM